MQYFAPKPVVRLLYWSVSIWLILLFNILQVTPVDAQCTNPTLFPVEPVIASAFNDTVVVSSNSNAGQYYKVKNLALNKSYVFNAKAGDFITIRNAYTNALLGSGPAPYTYAVGSGPDVVNVHLNLASPACGTDAAPRTTSVTCINCPAIGSKTGIGQPNPQATLDVGGEIKLGNSSQTPQAGMVRWNPGTNDFEGFDGTRWRSFSKANGSPGQWGQASVASIQENNRVTAADGAASDGFGYSVSINGDYAIVGAYLDDIGTNVNQGSAYIFLRNGGTWTQQAKLTASDGAAGDQFGISVSISGDYAIVGANFDTIGANARQGSAYVFIRNGASWLQQAKLTAADGAPFDNFGISVSISGDYTIVGASLADMAGYADEGAAYVFVRAGSSWSQQAKLTSGSLNAGSQFGISVAVSGDYAIVGRHFADYYSIATSTPFLDRGEAFVFLRNGSTWSQQATLIASDFQFGAQFGYSVGISGSYAIVGAWKQTSNRGQAYIYLRSGTTWSQQSILGPGTDADNTFFGNSVSISGDYAIVGAPGANNSSKSSKGAAYVFKRSGTAWFQYSKLIASDGGAGDNLGYSVGISGDHAIIGARGNDIGTNADQGAVYFIRKN